MPLRIMATIAMYIGFGVAIARGDWIIALLFFAGSMYYAKAWYSYLHRGEKK